MSANLVVIGYLSTLTPNREFIVVFGSRFREEEISMVPEGQVASATSLPPPI
jgi:hypothetical protein